MIESERHRLQLAHERVLTLYVIWQGKLALWRAHPLDAESLAYAQSQVDYWAQRLAAIQAELDGQSGVGEEAAG